MNAYNDQVDELMKDLGLPLWGVTDAREISKYQAYYDWRPKETVSNFETGDQKERCQTEGNFISVAFPYAHELESQGPASFSIYARGKDYHLVLRGYLERIAEWIRGMGFSAEVLVDSNHLPERLIAALSGLGYLGRNSTLITKEYGSFVFLGEIRTDLPLEIRENYHRPGDYRLCGSCRNCIRSCPVKILGGDYVETERCLSAVSQKKRASLFEMKALKGRLFGCDTCQMACPHNRGRAGRGLPDLKPYPHMIKPDLQELLFMTSRDFRERYKMTAAGWRGRPVLIRNAMIALSEAGGLPEGLSFESPLLKEALELLKKDAGLPQKD